MSADLDPRWEWVEIWEMGKSGPDYIKGMCNHLPSEVEPVKSVDGEVVAHLCRTCDEQLPAEWAAEVQGDDEPEGPCANCERCTWNPGPDCGKAEHPHCPDCGHCEGRHVRRPA